MPTNPKRAELLPYARHLRRNMTLAEQHLWQYLRNRQLNGIKFRRQHIIGTYIADFVSLQHGVIIELDGGQHAQNQCYDQQRTAFLNEQGFQVLRFWNHEVLQNTQAVLEQILVACGLPPP